MSMWTDIIFVATLLGCLIISSQYREVKETHKKKLFGACFGFFIMFMICGDQIAHPVFITVINLLIIIQHDKRFIHVKSLLLSFLYLTLMHVGIIDVSQITIEIQKLITLRLVGLCFEINTSYLIKNKQNLQYESEIFLNEHIVNNFNEAEEITLDFEFSEIIYYGYHFVGVLGGPYYSWRTFNDYFEMSLKNYSIISHKISRKLDNIPVTFVIYIWLNIFYPLNTYYFENSSFAFSTFWCCYNIPRLLIVYLHYYMITSICEAICIETGLGIYPASCNSEPGFGPTRNFELIEQMKIDHYILPNEKYNYNTVKMFGEYLILSDYRIRKSLKYCNMTTQYWFWANIYRRIPLRHRYIRTAITLIFWCLWNGPNVSNAILIGTILLYIYVEDIYSELFDNLNNIYGNAIYIGTHVICKTMCFLYFTPVLYGLETLSIINYYNSTGWQFHVFLFILLISGTILKRSSHKFKTTLATIPINSENKPRNRSKSV